MYSITENTHRRPPVGGGGGGAKNYLKYLLLENFRAGGVLAPIAPSLRTGLRNRYSQQNIYGVHEHEANLYSRWKCWKINLYHKYEVQDFWDGISVK